LAVAQLRTTRATEPTEILDVLETESARLEHMAQEFSEFGRLPQGPRTEIDLAELLTELTRTTLPPRVSHTLHVSPSLPTIHGQYDPLRRAFGNLITNAAEAMEGAGAIEVHLAEAGRAQVQVEIRDHGPGIPPEDRARVFEPYFTRKHTGTGLGLALAKQTIEHHQGSLELRPSDGGGTTAIVTLPVDGLEPVPGETS
jgi:two-component system nitrogen regulation sensor histidine kinase NtrY